MASALRLPKSLCLCSITSASERRLAFACCRLDAEKMSVLESEDIPLELIKSKIDELRDFLKISLSIANAHTVDFYTRNVWEEFIAVPPESVLAGISSSCDQRLSPENRGTRSCQRRAGEDGTRFGFCDDTNRLVDVGALLDAAKQHTLPGLGVCVPLANVLQTLQEHQRVLPNGEDSPLEPEEFMNSKKSHEVQIMSEVVSMLAQRCGVRQVIDVGSGKGYLCSYLSLQYGLQVYGIDSSSGNTHGAQERNRKLQKYSRAYQRHRKARTAICGGEQREREQLQGGRDQLQGGRDHLQGEREQLQGEREQLQGGRDHLQGEREQLQGGRDHLQGEREQLRGGRDHLQGEREQLQGGRDHLQGEREQLQGGRDHLQGEREQLQGGRDHLQGEREQLQGGRDHLQGEREQLQGERKQLQGGRDHLQGEREQLQGGRDHLQGEREQLQGGRDHLQGEREQLQGEREQLQGGRDHLQGEREQLRGGRDHLQGEREQLQGGRDHLQGEREQLQGGRDHLQGEREQLQGGRDHLQGEREQLQGGRDHLQGEREQLQGERKQLQGGRDHLQGEREQLQEERKQLQGGRDHLQGEREQLQGGRDHLQGEREQLQGGRDHLQGEREQLQGERKQLQGGRDHLQGEREQLQGERKQLQGEREQRQEEREQRQGEREQRQEERDHLQGERNCSEQGTQEQLQEERDHCEQEGEREKRPVHHLEEPVAVGTVEVSPRWNVNDVQLPGDSGASSDPESPFPFLGALSPELVELPPPRTPPAHLSVEERERRKRENLARKGQTSGESLFSPLTSYVTAQTELRDIITHLEEALLVGLHTCGDLAPSTLRMFTAKPELRAVCSVGCCYHLLSEEFDPSAATECPSSQWGFPMSKHLRDAAWFCGRNARMSACLALERVSAGGGLPTESLFYRAVLHVILRDHYGAFKSEKRVGNVYSKSTSFVDYVRRALRKLGLDDSELSDCLIQAYQERYSRRREEMQAFNMLKVSLAPCIEALILLDRLCYLKEQANTSFSAVVQLFDPLTSPRCYGIVALKKQSV